MADKIYVDPVAAIREKHLVYPDLLSVLSSDAGRRFISWLIYDAGQLEDECFDAGVRDGKCADLHAARVDGRRDRARALKHLVMQLAPDHYRAMNVEHTDAELLALREHPAGETDQ